MEQTKWIYSDCVSLRACDVDLCGRFKPSAMFFAMQEAAEAHSTSLGFSRQNMIERGVVWVLVRVRLDVVRFPVRGETVCLTTWPGTTTRALFPRYFRAEVDGETVAVAATQWMLVDTATHRMALPAEFGIVVEAGGDAPTEQPQRLRFCGEPTRTFERRVCYSDLDLNRHMNNARYVEWIFDAFESQRWEQSALVTLQINYLSEAKPDEQLTLELVEDADSFSLRALRGDGTAVFEAAGSFNQRGGRRNEGF